MPARAGYAASGGSWRMGGTGRANGAQAHRGNPDDARSVWRQCEQALGPHDCIPFGRDAIRFRGSVRSATASAATFGFHGQSCRHGWPNELGLRSCIGGTTRSCRSAPVRCLANPPQAAGTTNPAPVAGSSTPASSGVRPHCPQYPRHDTSYGQCHPHYIESIVIPERVLAPVSIVQWDAWRFHRSMHSSRGSNAACMSAPLCSGTHR
jgi:hypothetical protein